MRMSSRRIRAHTNPPLPEVRAWLSYAADGTIHAVKSRFADQLGLDPEQAANLVLLVDGFALLDGSQADILDANKDVVEIHFVQHGSASTSTSTAVAGPSSKKRSNTSQDVTGAFGPAKNAPSDKDVHSKRAQKRRKTSTAAPASRPAAAGSSMSSRPESILKSPLSHLVEESTAANKASSSVSHPPASGRSLPSARASTSSPVKAAKAEKALVTSSTHQAPPLSSSETAFAKPGIVRNKTTAAFSLPITHPANVNGNDNKNDSDSSDSDESDSSSSSDTSTDSSSSSEESTSSDDSGDSGPEAQSSKKGPDAVSAFTGSSAPQHRKVDTNSVANASATSAASGVPGTGKNTTKARNARKRAKHRILKAQRQGQAGQASASKSADGGLAGLDASIAADIAGQTESEKIVYAVPAGVLHTGMGIDMAISEALFPMLPIANKNKSRSMKRDAANGVKRVEAGKKIVFDGGSPRSEPSTSTPAKGTQSLVGGSPPKKSAARTNGSSDLTPAKNSNSILVKKPQPPPPSTRSDLPRNVVVSSVDVEAADFVPGAPQEGFQAPPQMPYRHKASSGDSGSMHASRQAQLLPKASTSSSATANSTTRKQKRQETSKLARSYNENVAAIAAHDAGLADELQALDREDWQDWPDLSDVEQVFEDLPRCSAPDEGEKIAVKILELSPASYLPAVSTYIGLVTKLESTPHSSQISVKLHPSCRPPSRVENGSAGMDGAEMPSESGENERPRFFGQDLRLDDHGLGDPSSKVISLDDIVDSRRLRVPLR